MTTPTEFHSFNQLPYQLRDKIWKLVLRPLDRAGAHFFNVEEREKQEDIGSFQQHDISITSLRMASPYWLHTCVGDTPKRNRSIYMVDSGLWTACKESRELMKKTFRPEISNHSTTGFCISSSLADSLSSGSPSFSSENAITVQRRYFTVFQNQDLFIYWKLNWSSPAWWDKVLNDGDPRDFLKKLGHYQKHLAIE